MSANFNALKNFIKKNGFTYSDELLYNLYVSLETKPFVILSGISGSGKSKIIDLFSDYYCQALDYEKNYELVAVKPNWTDNRGIFGFHNIIDNSYSITPTLKLFIRALQNPDKPYFLVLDEMNLAKVEHYFSDFLSLIESRKYYSSEKEVKKQFKIKNLNDSETTQGLRVSDAIILSAIDLGNEKDFYEISDFRNNRFSRLLGIHNGKVTEDGTPINAPDGSSSNWLAQYRTEINQNPPRLAGKLLESNTPNSGHPKYRLKDYDTLPPDLKNSRNLLDTKYLLLKKQLENENIVQKSINLHNYPNPLNTNPNQVDFSENGAVSSYSNLYDANSDLYYVPSDIPIPLNVFIIGTVNVDETTYMFSPKVLDRSNVIEFNDIDLFNAYGIGEEAPSHNIQFYEDKMDLTISLPTQNDTKWFYTTHPNEFNQLLVVFNLLKSQNKHFGFRVFDEISAYVKNYLSHTDISVTKALDNQILQKILPKINGDIEEIDDLLSKLLKGIDEVKYPQSVEKLNDMHSILKQTGYVTFIR